MKKHLINSFSCIFLVLLCGIFLIEKSHAQQLNIPAEVEKELIAKTLERAFIMEKDAPLYPYLIDKDKIYISTERPSLNQPDKPVEVLTKEMLPEFESVKFKLKTPKQIKRIGKKQDLLYARFMQTENYSGETAIIEMEMNWALSKRSIKRGFVKKSGSGYSILYKKVNGKWDDGKILRQWVN